jgi:hypothetical protein
MQLRNCTPNDPRTPRWFGRGAGAEGCVLDFFLFWYVAEQAHLSGIVGPERNAASPSRRVGVFKERHVYAIRDREPAEAAEFGLDVDLKPLRVNEIHRVH